MVGGVDLFEELGDGVSTPIFGQNGVYSTVSTTFFIQKLTNLSAVLKLFCFWHMFFCVPPFVNTSPLIHSQATSLIGQNRSSTTIFLIIFELYQFFCKNIRSLIWFNPLSLRNCSQMLLWRWLTCTTRRNRSSCFSPFRPFILHYKFVFFFTLKNLDRHIAFDCEMRGSLKTQLKSWYMVENCFSRRLVSNNTTCRTATMSRHFNLECDRARKNRSKQDSNFKKPK